MKKSLIFLLFGLLISCESNRLFEENTTLEGRYWRADQPIAFTFKINDASLTYNLYYNIRNSLEFPFARLFVEYSLMDSTGAVINKNLSTSYLFDQKTGKPLGESGIGDVFDHQVIIAEKYKFQNPGTYKLSLQQFNRADTLRGIISVGARIAFANK